jgi:DNA polymerase V
MPGAHTETTMTSDFVDELRRAVLTYVSRAAERLREQQLLVGALYVFVETNPFREDRCQYSRGITIQLPHATDDTLMLAVYTRAAIDRLTRRLSVQEGRHHAD